MNNHEETYDVSSSTHSQINSYEIEDATAFLQAKSHYQRPVRSLKVVKLKKPMQQ